MLGFCSKEAVKGKLGCKNKQHENGDLIIIHEAKRRKNEPCKHQ